MSSEEDFATDKVADEHAVQASKRHANRRDDQRIANGRNAFGEDHVIVLERERVIGPERRDQGRKQQQCVEISDQQCDGSAQRKQRVTHGWREDFHTAARTRFAGHRDVAAACEPVALQEENECGGNEQHDRQQCSTTQIKLPCDLQKSFGRKHWKIVACEDQWRREIGERTREQQQKCVGDTGH